MYQNLLRKSQQRRYNPEAHKIVLTIFIRKIANFSNTLLFLKECRNEICLPLASISTQPSPPPNTSTQLQLEENCLLHSRQQQKTCRMKRESICFLDCLAGVHKWKKGHNLAKQEKAWWLGKKAWLKKEFSYSIRHTEKEASKLLFTLLIYLFICFAASLLTHCNNNSPGIRTRAR